jgi:cyclopropane-fatty-acyl-phospholipid synthase
MDLVKATTQLFESPSRAFAVRLWDGTVLPPGRDEGIDGQVVLTQPAVLGTLVPPVSERRLAEAYLDGDVELVGDTVAVLDAAARWDGPRVRGALAPALIAGLFQRVMASAGAGSFVGRRGMRLHSVARDRDAVRHHYDVSDDLYRLFLDDAMVYSCAYFASGHESLEEAQRAKLDLVCRKLRLGRGERLLDVGCGWGALLAHAKEAYGADATGITVSQNQLDEVRRRVAGLRGGGRAEVLAADYRTLPADRIFDKVASVGMMEHVGRAHLDAYFGAIEQRLVPGGLFLNHAIADASSGATTIPWAGRGRDGGFIDRYIFPDGDLVPLGQVVAAAEKAGFEVRDVESLREHYAETLEVWLSRLEARFAEAERTVGLRRARAYRLYLASSAAAFRVGRISVYQLLLAKRAPDGRAKGVPRCRADWYRDLGNAGPAVAVASAK